MFKFRGFFLSKTTESYWEQLNEAFTTALTELGLGAKTAVGYGRFEIQSGDEKTKSESIAAKKEIWEQATLTYTPNNGLIEATFKGHKARTQDKELIPDELQTKLFKKKKRKAVPAKVEVETIGNSFRIVGIC